MTAHWLESLVSRIAAPARSGADAVERRMRVLRWIAIAIGVAVPLLGLLPEIVWLSPDVNDGGFHQGIAERTIGALREGANPLDFWFPAWLAGFPLFHYYQPGPYWLLAVLHVLFLGKVPLLVLYRAVTILALAAFPLASHRAMRWMGFGPDAAAGAAFLSCLVSGGGTYGIEFESFTWMGWGLFAQAVALPLLPLALAGGYRAVEGGRRTLGYSALLLAALLGHILYGYIAAVSLVILPFLAPGLADVRRRLLALLRFGVQTGALAAFFVVPLWLHSAYHAKSLYDEASKFDSHGASVVLSRLIGGTLLDSGRLPILTCLVAAGLYLAAREWLERKGRAHGWLACCLLLWVALYFGRATWGPLMKLLPMSHGLHLERLVNGVHVFAILLAAVALGALARWALGFESPAVRGAATAALVLAVALPLLAERTRYLVRDAELVRDARRSWLAAEPAFRPVADILRQDPEGRVYAGHSGNWGAAYNVGRVHVYHLLSARAIPDISNAPFSWSLSTDFQFQFNPWEAASYALFDVRYLLTDQAGITPPGGTLLVHSGPHRLWRVPAEGRFGIVSVPIAVRGGQEDAWYANMAWIKGGWARQRAHAELLFTGREKTVRPVVETEGPFRYIPPGENQSRSYFEPPGLTSAAPPPPARGRLRDERVSPNDARVTAELEEPGVVLFKTSFHPGWRATLDGKRIPTMQLTPGFTGIAVPSGTHEIRMAYRAGAMKALLLVLGLLAALAIDRVPALPRGRDDR